MATTRITAAASLAQRPLRSLGIGACYGINMGHGWAKLLAVFEPDDDAARLAMETATATTDALPDGVAAPRENELEVIFPAMIAAAGDLVEGSIARTDLVYWDAPYLVGEDALARTPRNIPAQARLQDNDFLPILTRGAFARLMKLAQARIDALVALEMLRLRGEPLQPYSRLLAEELEKLRGVRFSPENTGDGWTPGAATSGTRSGRRLKEPYPGANAELEAQVRARIVAREGRRGALPEQLRGGPAITGLPAAWNDLPGYPALLGKRLRAGAPGITQMRSIAEPLAILYATALNGNGDEINPAMLRKRHAFVDMGYLSIDLGEVYDMAPQRETLDTWELGAAGPISEIRRHLHAHFDYPFEPAEVELAIRSGKVRVGGKDRDLPLHWDAPLIRRGAELKDRLVARWRSGRQFETIQVAGGWAAEERIVGPIVATFDNAAVVARSQAAIARGYAYLARRQAAERAAKAAQGDGVQPAARAGAAWHE